MSEDRDDTLFARLDKRLRVVRTRAQLEWSTPSPAEWRELSKRQQISLALLQGTIERRLEARARPRASLTVVSWPRRSQSSG
jgi:hypothetical protein